MLSHLKDEHFFKLSKCENVYVRHLLAKRSTLSVKKNKKKNGSNKHKFGWNELFISIIIEGQLHNLSMDIEDPIIISSIFIFRSVQTNLVPQVNKFNFVELPVN